jgi:hypothetical protein
VLVEIQHRVEIWCRVSAIGFRIDMSRNIFRNKYSFWPLASAILRFGRLSPPPPPKVLELLGSVGIKLFFIGSRPYLYDRFSLYITELTITLKEKKIERKKRK